MIGVELPQRAVEKFTLDNGLTLIVRQDPSAPVVSMQGWCETGSIHEGDWLGGGLSHYLEHMLFKGTDSRPAEQVAREVASMGGNVNAYTSFDRTVYYIDSPAESCVGCLDVLMDIVSRATLPEDEFEREGEVIRREFAMGNDDPDRVARQELFATAFSVHPYRVPVIGYLDVFNELCRDDLMGYYRERYAPNNLFFVVVGDVDPSQIRDQMVEFYAEIPRRSLAPVHVPQEPKQLGRRDVFKPFDTPVNKLWFAWDVPGITHPDMPALDVLAAIMGDGRSSRLHREVRERRGVVHRIDAYSYTPADAGLFAIGADLDPERRSEAEAAVFDVVGDLLEGGVSEEEIAKAQHMALAAQFGSLVTMGGQAADLGSNWIHTRNLDFTREYLRRVATVGRDAVVEVARRYFIDGALSVVEVGKENRGSKGGKIVRSKGNEVTEFTLDNGLEVVVERDTRLPLISLSSAFRAGLLAEDAQHSGLTALYATNILQGAAGKSAEELAGAIESLGGSIYASGGNNSYVASAGLMAPDAATAFEVMGDILAEPTFPDDALERERASQLAGLVEENDRPVSAAFRAARRSLFGEHPYARTSSGEQEALAALGREQLCALHQHYAVGSNGALAICGDIDPGQARELAERSFGRLAQGERAFEKVQQPAWPAGDIDETIKLDKEQGVVVLAVPGVPVGSEDRAALELIEGACSGMDGRLFLRIREELGLAYSTGATQFFGLCGGALMFYVATRPDAVDDVAAELTAQLDLLAEGGLEDAELERCRRVYAGRHALQKQSHGARAQGAALAKLYDLGADYDERLLKEIQSLDSSKVADSARRYLSGVSRICIKVLP